MAKMRGAVRLTARVPDYIAKALAKIALAQGITTNAVVCIALYEYAVRAGAPVETDRAA